MSKAKAPAKVIAIEQAPVEQAPAKKAPAKKKRLTKAEKIAAAEKAARKAIKEGSGTCSAIHALRAVGYAQKDIIAIGFNSNTVYRQVRVYDTANAK